MFFLCIFTQVTNCKRNIAYAEQVSLQFIAQLFLSSAFLPSFSLC